MNFYDNHTHSHFSPDSRMTMEQSVACARSLHLSGISITDHLDLDIPEGRLVFEFSPAEQQAEIERLREKYGVSVFKGIEIGLQPHALEKSAARIAGYPMDIVIASIHFVDGQDPYYGTYYEGKNYKQAYGRAFEVMYETAAAYKDFDVLGHIDYIARYAPYKERDILYKEFPDSLDKILRYLAENGKALEINTNTYRERNGYTPTPDPHILKRFRELGGEAVSLGSDAHETFRLAENFKKYTEFIRYCGFSHLVYYKNRKPVFYKPD